MSRAAVAPADVGTRLVRLARAAGAPSIAVVGTMKNAGKTVAFGAVCDALARAGVPYAAVSAGRDGEAIDSVSQTAKPRVSLVAGTLFATATGSLPRHPAAEILAITEERAALGRVALARARVPCEVELAGPATADGVRRVVRELGGDGTFVVLDGAIDRLAALRDGDEAIVVAAGAAGTRTMQEAAVAARALVARLALRALETGRDAVVLTGALTASGASDFARTADGRPLLIDDATRIAFGGRALLAFLERHEVRVRRALRPIACTVAPAGPGASYEPRAFLEAIAEATGLPAFDVYAGEGCEVAA